MRTGVDHFGEYDHSKVREEVRIRLAARLDKLLDDLEPMVDPASPANMGEVSPAMVSAYTAVVKTMGGLYQTFTAPESNHVPLEVVEQMVQEARIEAARLAVEEYQSTRALEGRRTVEEARTALADAIQERLDKAEAARLAAEEDK